MEEFNHNSVSRQELNVRAAHSLCRAGWMLEEINGVLQRGYIRPENFRIIQQQATTFDQLQQKFGPPKPLRTSTTDSHLVQINTTKLPRILVMNRGVEEATAVLTHYGWSTQQIRQVLKGTMNPLDNIGLALMNDLSSNGNRSFSNRYRYKRSYPYYLPVSSHRKSKAATLRTLLILFWLGVFAFIGVLLILHML
ncbi:hypothetical protein [Leptothoe kymatousa]|uniref:Uncharacterized protein n=1 Tax=Leptothoe kymatousa TAU-MAC 1615 TaxID=2364775 RepID=A0ABS5Y7D3_9CYAN|nr:hypothetical protein [Leptothoe kymatousa]MBT9313259.1 hypothetical protein [Leptothoe kymatousa TAU-MAC 1615]